MDNGDQLGQYSIFRQQLLAIIQPGLVDPLLDFEHFGSKKQMFSE